MSFFDRVFKSNASSHRNKHRYSKIHFRSRMTTPTPWGKPALRLKTRKKRKGANKLIVRRRAATSVMHPGVVVSNLGLVPTDNPVRAKVSYGERKALPDYFGDALDFLMNEVDLTEEELSQLAGISEKQIERWLKNPAPRPTVENVMLLCIAMRLSSRYSHQLFKLAGIVLREKSPLENMYLSILEAPIYSISEYNQMLVDMKFPPLTKKNIVDEDDIASTLYPGYKVIEKI